MAREAQIQKQKRALRILKRLMREYPYADIQLNFKTPMQLLAAVILSAQTTDEQVNKTTENLFKKYKTINNFASLNMRSFQGEINSVNFYKNKARFIINSARMIRDEYDGKIPNSMEELIKLPGVARKTANVVQYQLYRKAEGIPVDTHVKRVARKLKLTSGIDPNKIEKDLMNLYHHENWGRVSYYFQAYGRAASPARGKPKTEDPLSGLY